MKYSEFNKEVPRLFLGAVVNEGNNAWDIQYQIRAGKTVVEEGVARTIASSIKTLDDIDVEADGLANNVKLSTGHEYLVIKGFKPDVKGLGARKN